MKKKISVILISILLLATSIVIYQKDMDVKADDGGGDGGDIGLDTMFEA